MLLYHNSLTLRESGDILGASESRICQLHGELTRKLRKDLQEHEQLFAEVTA